MENYICPFTQTPAVGITDLHQGRGRTPHYVSYHKMWEMVQRNFNRAPICPTCREEIDIDFQYDPSLQVRVTEAVREHYADQDDKSAPDEYEKELAMLAPCKPPIKIISGARLSNYKNWMEFRKRGNINIALLNQALRADIMFEHAISATLPMAFIILGVSLVISFKYPWYVSVAIGCAFIATACLPIIRPNPLASRKRTIQENLVWLCDRIPENDTGVMKLIDLAPRLLKETLIDRTKLVTWATKNVTNCPPLTDN